MWSYRHSAIYHNMSIWRRVQNWKQSRTQYSHSCQKFHWKSATSSCRYTAYIIKVIWPSEHTMVMLTIDSFWTSYILKSGYDRQYKITKGRVLCYKISKGICIGMLKRWKEKKCLWFNETKSFKSVFVYMLVCVCLCLHVRCKLRSWI